MGRKLQSLFCLAMTGASAVLLVLGVANGGKGSGQPAIDSTNQLFFAFCCAFLAGIATIGLPPEFTLRWPIRLWALGLCLPIGALFAWMVLYMPS